MKEGADAVEGKTRGDPQKGYDMCFPIPDR